CYQPHYDHDHNWQPHSECAKVVEPLGCIKAHHVEYRDDRQRNQRKYNVVAGAAREIVPMRSADIKSIAGCEVKNGGKVRKVACPVSPGSQKTSKVAVFSFSPHI